MFSFGFNVKPRKAGGVSYDADAQAFFTAASITDTTQKSAVNQLVLDLKSYGVWTKCSAIYPIVGGSASSHAVNLKTPGTFNLTFATGMTHSSTGMVSNGTSGYANTSLIPQTFYSTNMHLSYYSRTSTIQTVQEIGANQSTNYSSLAVARNTIFGQTTNGLVNYLSQSNALGFFVGQKVSNSSRKVYRNGTLNNSTTTTDSNTLPNNNVYICALNVNNTPANYSIKQCAFASIGSGLTDTEAANFYTAVQAYQTTLSRQV